MKITTAQYQMLMQGVKIVTRHPIEEVIEPVFTMCFMQNVENKMIFTHDGYPVQYKI